MPFLLSGIGVPAAAGFQPPRVGLAAGEKILGQAVNRKVDGTVYGHDSYNRVIWLIN
jgi:hypothetical protein